MLFRECISHRLTFCDRYECYILSRKLQLILFLSQLNILEAIYIGKYIISAILLLVFTTFCEQQNSLIASIRSQLTPHFHFQERYFETKRESPVMYFVPLASVAQCSVPHLPCWILKALTRSCITAYITAWSSKDNLLPEHILFSLQLLYTGCCNAFVFCWKI